MRLAEVLKDVPAAENPRGDLSVSGIAVDSRTVLRPVEDEGAPVGYFERAPNRFRRGASSVTAGSGA